MENITNNIATLANANIDWSLSGGMIWLTSLVVILGASLLVGLFTGSLR